MRNYLNINAINKNDVLHLIQRALALKSGEQPKTKTITAVNLFLKIQRERIVVSKWQRINLIGNRYKSTLKLVQ